MFCFLVNIIEKKIKKRESENKKTKEQNQSMEFSITNLFEFLEDISIICSCFMKRVWLFTTPYFLSTVHFGIRSYLWIQNLPFFQQKKHPYVDILVLENWSYIGILIHTIQLYPEYKMIHHYQDLIKDQDQVVDWIDIIKDQDQDTIDTLYLIQRNYICICRRNPFTFVKPEKSNIRFLYVEFISISKGITISLDIPEEMMQVGNELFTPAFLYRLLDHSSCSSPAYVFDHHYYLDIVDENLNTIHIYSDKYMILEKNTYQIV